MWFLKKKVIHKDTRVVNALEEIRSLAKEPVDENSLVRLNRIVRRLLKEKYHIGEGLTAEEADKKISEKKLKNEIKYSLVSLLNEINRREYHQSSKPDGEEFIKLLKISFDSIRKIPHREISEDKNSEKADSEDGNPKEETQNEKIRNSENFRNLLGEVVYLERRSNLKGLKPSDPKMREAYEKIKEKYSMLDEKDKRKIYPRIMTLFNLK